MYNIETQTNVSVDIQVHNEKTLIVVIDGEAFALTRDDAARIGAKLQEFALQMQHT